MVDAIEAAKQAGIEQGRREQRIEDLENDLKKHQDECTERSQRVWLELKQIARITYIGLGMLLALQALGTWTDFFK